jgi:hypothetical protein
VLSPQLGRGARDRDKDKDKEDVSLWIGPATPGAGTSGLQVRPGVQQYVWAVGR